MLVERGCACPRWASMVFCALLAACGGGAAGSTAGNSAAAGQSAAVIAGAAAAGMVAAPVAGSPARPGVAGQTGGTGPAGAPAATLLAGSGSGGMFAAGGGAMASVAGTGGVMAAAGIGGAAGAPAAAGCDRACLLQMMQMYLEAVIAHDPSKVPISATAKVTDNGVTAKPGDGLWKTASMLVKDERLDYADPVTKNVGTQCVINEGSTPAMYEVRLKVDSGQIVEIESMTVRQADAANGFFDPSQLKPQPVFLQMPDPAKRMTRDQLQTTLEMYLDYLEGKKSGSQVPFDANCARYENGVATASGLSAFNFQSWSFEVTRRILILDEEAGIAWGMFPFQQTDDALVVGEAFKILDGKIMMIQAVMAYMPSKAWQ